MTQIEIVSMLNNPRMRLINSRLDRYSNLSSGYNKIKSLYYGYQKATVNCESEGRVYGLKLWS